MQNTRVAASFRMTDDMIIENSLTVLESEIARLASSTLREATTATPPTDIRDSLHPCCYPKGKVLIVHIEYVHHISHGRFRRLDVCIMLFHDHQSKIDDPGGNRVAKLMYDDVSITATRQRLLISLRVN
jgi:hypothetical protein